jgi:hypothetical protein
MEEDRSQRPRSPEPFSGGHGYILRAKKMARNGGKSTSGIRIQHRLSSKWTTKAAREQKRGQYAGSNKMKLRRKLVTEKPKMTVKI